MINLKIFISENEFFQQRCDKMCGKLKFLQVITFTWKMTSIVKWAIFLIPLKLIIIMINEILMLM